MPILVHSFRPSLFGCGGGKLIELAARQANKFGQLPGHLSESVNYLHVLLG